MAKAKTQSEAEVIETTETESQAKGEAAPHITKAGRHSAKALAEAEAEAQRKEAAKDHAEKPVAKKAKQQPNPLKVHGKRYRAAAEQIDRSKLYGLTEAIELARSTSNVKFDAAVELHANLGVDPRQADQMVRASVVLPAGTGKALRVAVIADGDQLAAAKSAGADLTGGEDLITKIEKGQLNFDRLIVTPTLMSKLSKLAKILGPKGLMPNPKSGTVTPDVAKAIKDAKGGKVEFRIDKQAIVHQAIGRVSFKASELETNAKTLIDAILKAKPAAAKGTYIQAITITTSMGPGIKLDPTAAIAAANPKILANKK